MTPESKKTYDAAYAKSLSRLNWEAQIWYDVPAEDRPAPPAWLRVLPLLSTLPFMRPTKAELSEARRAVGEAWRMAGGPELYTNDLSHMSRLDRVAIYTLRAWQQHFDGSESWARRLEMAEDEYCLYCREQAAERAAALTH